MHRLRQFLDSESDVYAALESQVEHADERIGRIRIAKELASEWDHLEPKAQRAWLRSLIRRIDLELESLGITIDRVQLAE